MSEPNLIEKKRSAAGMRAGPTFDIGDHQSFLYAVVWALIALLSVSYVGSVVLTVLGLEHQDLKRLFPTDLHAPPYKFSAQTTPQVTLESLTTKGRASGDTGRDMIEYIFPMKSPGFPYYSWFIPLNANEACKTTVSYTISKWYALTCAGTFSMWRHFNIILILVGKWMLETFPSVSDFFLFYIYPYMLYYAVLLPVIPVIGSGMAVASSVINNIPGGWALTFAPMMGMVAAVANLFTAGIFNIYSWALSMMIGFAGFAMGYVNMGWWGAIGVALWFYAIGMLFMAPIFITDGFSKVASTFKNHRISLLIITLLIVIRFSMMFLAAPVTGGIIAGALYCLYRIIKSACADTVPHTN